MPRLFGNSDKVTEASEVLTLVRGSIAGGGVAGHSSLSLDSTVADVLDISVAQVLSMDSAVTRGDLIYADSTPKWTRLALGSTSQHLESDNTDISWVTNLTMADNAWIGISGAGARTVFSSAGNAVSLRSAADLVLYSDDGVTLQASIDGTAGHIVTEGDLTFNDASAGVIHQDNTAGKVLRADGTRYVPNTIQTADLPDNAANPTASVALTAVNGTATTWMRSDAAPALDESISPTWTGRHYFRRTVNALADLADRTNYHLMCFNPANDTGEMTALGFYISAVTTNVGAAVGFERTDGNTKGKLGFYTKQVTTDAVAPALVLTLGDDGASTFEGGLTINEGSNDDDTRIEGNTDANLFYVDAGNDRVIFKNNAADSNETADVTVFGSLTATNAASTSPITAISYGSGGTTTFPTFRGRSSQGTRASPTATQSGDVVGRFGGAGYGTSFPSVDRAFMQAKATQNYTGSAHGTELEFYVTPDGDTSPALEMQLTDDGRLEIGNNAGTAGRPLHVYHATTDIVATFKSGDAAAGISLQDNSGSSWIFANPAGSIIYFDNDGDGTGEVAIGGAAMYPVSAKNYDLGTASKEWDNIYYVTANTGTSRLINSSMRCPICGEQMKKGTGSVNILGEVADYEMVFCIECGNVAMETRNSLTPKMLSERRPPPKIVLEDIATKRMGGHDWKTTVHFQYGENGESVQNATRLGDNELAAMQTMTPQEIKVFIQALGEREWYAMEEGRIMGDHASQVGEQHRALVAHLVGKDLLREV